MCHSLTSGALLTGLPQASSPDLFQSLLKEVVRGETFSDFTCIATQLTLVFPTPPLLHFLLTIITSRHVICFLLLGDRVPEDKDFLLFPAAYSVPSTVPGMWYALDKYSAKEWGKKPKVQSELREFFLYPHSDVNVQQLTPTMGTFTSANFLGW